MLVNHKRVLRILREDNLLAVQPRAFVVTTDSDHELEVYLNLASRMKLRGMNQLWVADITYIRLKREFVWKKEKSGKKERTEGLWKLTLLMEIRKGRGFPQPLEKSLAKDTRLFHSSHRPNNKDLFTIIYCRHDQKPWNGTCANSKLSQQRGSPQATVPNFVPTLFQNW